MNWFSTRVPSLRVFVVYLAIFQTLRNGILETFFGLTLPNLTCGNFTVERTTLLFCPMEKSLIHRRANP